MPREIGYTQFIRGRIARLIKIAEPPPLNSPPVWDTQPSVNFVQGTASSYDLGALTSDADLDTVNVTLNTGTVSLPSGVTYNAGTDTLEYDGVGANASTSGHIATASDGTETTDSNSFSITIANWPANGAHSQSAANVSSIDTQLSDPFWSPMQRKKDLIYLQGRYPSASRVQITVEGIQDMRTDNSNLKVLQYIYPQRTDDSGTTDILGLSWEIVEDNNAATQWRGVDANSDDQIRDNQGRYFLNCNWEGTDPGDSHDNFILAWLARMQTKQGTGAANNLMDEIDGWFLDSADYKDQFPSQKRADLTTSANIDYLKPKSSGNTSPVLYRDGWIYAVTQSRLEFGSDQVWSSNGGRDGDAVNDTTANNEWAGFWDHRLLENVDDKLGLEKKSGVNEMECVYSNMDPRLEKAIRSALISMEMVDTTSANRLGKGVVSLDFVFEWSGADPISISDIPQDFYEAARFICGLACLDDNFMAAPCLERGEFPFPFMDEFVYDPGSGLNLAGTAPETPTIGSIDNTDATLPLTIRTADKAAEGGAGLYGFYAQRYSGSGGNHILWVVNLNEPSKGDWPQATEDTFTLPSPQSGKKWTYADSNYTNSNRTTGATACENQSPLINTGGDVGSTIDMKRWHARMLVEADV